MKPTYIYIYNSTYFLCTSGGNFQENERRDSNIQTEKFGKHMNYQYCSAERDDVLNSLVGYLQTFLQL